MAEGDFGSGALSTALTAELLEDVNFTIPSPDLSGSDFIIPDEDPDNPIYGPIVRLTNNHLTEKKIGGTGSFDVLMDGFKVHLKQEYEAGRITGEQYTKAYIELTTAAMGNAVQYLLARDQSYWAAIQAQQQARLVEVQVVSARVNLETAKVQLSLAQFQALTAQADYALTKLKLATEAVNYGIQEYQLSDILPSQKAQLLAQTEMVTAQIANVEEETLGVTKKNLLIQEQIALAELEGLKLTEETTTLTAQRTNLLPKQILQVEAQTAQVEAQTLNVTAQTEDLIPSQIAQGQAQVDLLFEQRQAARAQTSETRSDGNPVEGMLAKQKLLYGQQITSYQRDAEVKAAKMFVDAWITQKTLDEGLLAPQAFVNATIDEVMSAIQTNNGLGTVP
jgi:hypothetical protein